MIATARPRGGHRIVNNRPQRTGQHAERGQAAQEAARRADAAERPHPEAENERAGMNKQSFEHVLVPAHVRRPEPAGLVEMRVCSATMCQASILVLELLQPLHLTEVHAAEFRLPAIVGLLGNAVAATQVGDLPTGFALLDDRQDLFVGEFAPSQRSSSERRTSF
jgi:hypothetical protein